MKTESLETRSSGTWYEGGYTWEWTEYGANDLTITKVSPTPTGTIIIPSKINENPVTGVVGSLFSGCHNLTKIVFSDNIITTNQYTCKNCIDLSSVTLGNNLKYIGSGAFSGCISLTSIVIPDTVTSIGSNAFNNCYDLASFIIPGNVTSIGKTVFYCCTKLTNITIGNSLSSIDQDAFYGCSKLSIIYYTRRNSESHENAETRVKNLVDGKGRDISLITFIDLTPEPEPEPEPVPPIPPKPIDNSASCGYSTIMMLYNQQRIASALAERRKYFGF